MSADRERAHRPKSQASDALIVEYEAGSQPKISVIFGSSTRSRGNGRKTTRPTITASAVGLVKFLIGGLATGTIQFQGQNQDKFRTALSPRSLVTPTASVSAAANAKIFVVHGHDRDVRDPLELVLMRLGLQPFILQNPDGESKTIIEALEQNIYLKLRSESFF